MRKCQQLWAECLARRLPGRLAALWAAAGGLPCPALQGASRCALGSPSTEHFPRSSGGAGLLQGWLGRVELWPWPHRAPEEEEGRWEEGKGDAGHTLGLGQADEDWCGSMYQGTSVAFTAFWPCFLLGGWDGKSSSCKAGGAGHPRTINWAPRPACGRGDQVVPGGARQIKAPRRAP